MDTTSCVALGRLLNRLEHTLLSPAADSRLRQSRYERAKVRANLEHARDLLVKIDRESAGIQLQSQKQQIQADLTSKKDAIKRLSARLSELQELDRQEESDSSDEEGRGVAGEKAALEQDTLREFAPARSDISSGIAIGESEQPSETNGDPVREQTQQTQSLQQELRARKPLQASDNRSAASTTARDQLFAGRKQHPDLETTEALMSHNREEQDALSKGLLGLARALKDSSLNFASSLEAEKDVMKRAEGSLDKSAQGMDQAEKKMGLLRRMSEGQGWWGRMKLYGFIAGLWLACFLLVFVGPKLRF